MKKCLAISIIMFLIIGIIGGTVNAAGSTVSASSKSTTAGDTVTVTVSFGQNVKGAQFNLGYDSSALEYVSYSCGGSGNKNFAGNKFGYAGAKTPDISSVSFTFKAKTTSTKNVTASNLKISTADANTAPTDKCGISISVKQQTSSGDNSGNSSSGSNSSNNSNSSSSSNTSTTKKTTTKKTTNSATKKTTSTKTSTTEEEQPEEAKEEPAPKEIIKLDSQEAKTIENAETGVMIKALPVAIAEDMLLDVNLIEFDSINYERVSTILAGLKGKKTYYDIKLLQNNAEVQPNGYVTVCIPIPDNYNKENLELYYINEQSESYELIKGEIQEDTQADIPKSYYTFTTNHFSTYVLLEKAEEVEATIETGVIEQKIDSTTDNIIFYKIIGGLIAVILILIVIIIRKK